jgi:hypothetical protein
MPREDTRMPREDTRNPAAKAACDPERLADTTMVEKPGVIRRAEAPASVAVRTAAAGIGS